MGVFKKVKKVLTMFLKWFLGFVRNGSVYGHQNIKKKKKAKMTNKTLKHA